MEKDIQPNCIASDGTKLYAHYVGYVGGYSGDQTVFLAVSNADPSTLNGISWKIISYYPQTKLYYLQGLASIRSFVCGVDSQGTFTILSYSSKSSRDDQAPSRTRGYQFSLTTNSWTNIDVTNSYKWTILGESVIVNIPNGNSNVLMHIYSTSNVDKTITFSIFNQTSRTFVEQDVSWPIPSGSGTPYGYAVSNNNLYVTSSDFLTQTATLNIIPLNPTATPPNSASIKVLKAPASLATNCGPMFIGGLRSTVVGSNYYLFCSNAGRELNYLTTSDSNTIAEPIRLNMTVSYPESFFPFGDGSGEGAPTWAFVNNSTNIFGLTLSGENKGQWEVPPYSINATGYPGSGDGGGSENDSGPNNPSSSEGLSQTVLIVIIVSSVIFLGSLISTVSKWRRKRNIHTVEILGTSNTPYMSTQEYNYQPPFFQPQVFQPQVQQQLLQQQGTYYDPEKCSPSPIATTAVDYGSKLPATTALLVPPSMHQQAQSPQEYTNLTGTQPAPPNFDSSPVTAWSPAASGGSALNTLYPNNPQYNPSMEGGQYDSESRNPQSYLQGAAPQDFGNWQPPR
ncbi:hypothetical protein BGX27_009806 [Mortierella sp. AM989]|nr:hypothetical protein BGX27_009806 [Mortierella sp. AM989]